MISTISNGTSQLSAPNLSSSRAAASARGGQHTGIPNTAKGSDTANELGVGHRPKQTNTSTQRAAETGPPQAQSGGGQSDSAGPSAASQVALFFILRNKRTLLLALRNLYKSQQQIDQASERLTTGKRINEAADDAAGSAIANRMTARITSLQQASANVDDGLALAKTADGTLVQINSHLQRIRQLTVKAANETNSPSDLKEIQEEINALLAAIDRMSDKSQYKDVKLFDKDKSVEIQVGFEDSQVVAIDLAQVNTKSLRIRALTVDGYEGTLTPVRQATFDDVKLDHNGIASRTVATDVSWASSKVTANDLALVHDAHGDYFARGGSSSNPNVYAINRIKGVAGTDTTDAQVVVSVDGSHTEAQNTAEPMGTLDSALQDVTRMRVNLGATQSQLHSIIANIATTVLGLTSARSRLVDTNYAATVSRLSKARIVQNASIAVIAQANQTSRGVSALLR